MGGDIVSSYVYDTANQLIRENNQELGKTWTWTYDAAGNIVNRKEYAYSTADDDELGTPTDTVLYGYTDATWGDLLTSYDGTGITYDVVGNPLTDGTWTYTWEHGRQLAGLYGEDVNGGTNDVTVTYTYDADGMRIGKTVVTRTYEENHTHSYVAETFAPTCINRGYTIYTCACGDSYTGNYVSALGHNFVNSKCTRCNMTQNPGIITPITPITPIPGIGTSEVSEEVVTQSTTTRVLKSTQTVTYKYVYNGGSLSQMVVTTTTNDGDPTTYVLNFQYDASGTPMSMVINGSEKLYYVTNLQGDVTALLNESGNEVAEYTYSAYGEIDSHFYVTGTNNIVGAMYNPLKYRGYVHDIETDWYYLQSRYYDPEVGRFLNADALVSTGQGFEGNNMFAYCGNNPVRYTDSAGFAYREALSQYNYCEYTGEYGGLRSNFIYDHSAGMAYNLWPVIDYAIDNAVGALQDELNPINIIDDPKLNAALSYYSPIDTYVNYRTQGASIGESFVGSMLSTATLLEPVASQIPVFGSIYKGGLWIATKAYDFYLQNKIASNPAEAAMNKVEFYKNISAATSLGMNMNVRYDLLKDCKECLYVRI